MLIPDFSFNPSAGLRNDNAGDFVRHTGQFGTKPYADNQGLQLNIKDVRVTHPETSDSSVDMGESLLKFDRHCC